VTTSRDIEMAHGATWPHDQLLHAWWVEPDRLLALVCAILAP
jgi:hypothetical protein